MTTLNSFSPTLITLLTICTLLVSWVNRDLRYDWPCWLKTAMWCLDLAFVAAIFWTTYMSINIKGASALAGALCLRTLIQLRI